MGVPVRDEPWTSPLTREVGRYASMSAEAKAAEDQLTAKLADGMKNKQRPMPDVDSSDIFKPTVDMPRVQAQMNEERVRYLEQVAQGNGTYRDLCRYGGFLMSARAKLAEVHHTASQKHKVARALVERAKDAREWSKRDTALQKVVGLMEKVEKDIDLLNKYVGELLSSPGYVHAMAMVRAQDEAMPAWDRSFGNLAAAGRNEPAEFQPMAVDADIDFETLLRLEKAHDQELQQQQQQQQQHGQAAAGSGEARPLAAAAPKAEVDGSGGAGSGGGAVGVS